MVNSRSMWGRLQFYCVCDKSIKVRQCGRYNLGSSDIQNSICKEYKNCKVYIYHFIDIWTIIINHHKRETYYITHTQNYKTESSASKWGVIDVKSIKT